MWPIYFLGALLHASLSALFLWLPRCWEYYGISLDTTWQYYAGLFLCSGVLILPGLIWLRAYAKQLMTISVLFLLVGISSCVLVRVFFGVDDLSIFLLALLLFFAGFTYLEAMLPSQLAFKLKNELVSLQEKKGLAMGIYSSCQFLGIFIGGALGGLIGVV